MVQLPSRNQVWGRCGNLDQRDFLLYVLRRSGEGELDHVQAEHAPQHGLRIGGSPVARSEQAVVQGSSISVSATQGSPDISTAPGFPLSDCASYSAKRRTREWP
ncbi:hypothetical protein SAMN05216489_09763 [Streptomyces sp. 3213]|nr:hypothetical protein SAMN05216489_09763 [Streptomyces sp. 3213] [Streptomyces sp. 3213.3]